MKNTITQTKLNLIKKIVNARLTPEELQSVTDKAKSIIKSRETCKAYERNKLFN